jgi:putative ATP-dependent endonuclease of the OLD family
MFSRFCSLFPEKRISAHRALTQQSLKKISFSFRMLIGWRTGLKSVGSKELCRFKSGRPHHFLLVLVQPVDFMSTNGPTTSSPTIRRLAINRFRGIEKLTWCPQPGLNIILGGGDAGKSTILDALALLLNPSSAAAISDSDFWKREAEPDGFEIEAVMSLPDSAGVHNQSKQSWPWDWDGKTLSVPSIDDAGAVSVSGNPVFCLRVRANADFELSYEIVQPDGTADFLPVAVRRAIGLVRLGGDDRNDRDLRLVQGSALDRLLSDQSLRARLGLKLGENQVEEQLKQDAKDKLELLDDAFAKRALPAKLGLGLTPGQGFSIGALKGSGQHQCFCA